MSLDMFNDAFMDLLAERVAAKLRLGGDLSGAVRKPWRPEELAEVLGCSKDTIYARVRAGTISVVPEIGRVLIPYPEVERLTEGRAL